MASNTDRKATCLHRILRVDEVNILGATVSCLRCDLTFHIGEENIEEYFYAFHHNSPRGPDKDLDILLHFSVLGDEE